MNWIYLLNYKCSQYIVYNCTSYGEYIEHVIICYKCGFIIFNFVDTPRNFIIAKLSIRKPGSSSVLINQILLALMKIRVYGSKALR